MRGVSIKNDHALHQLIGVSNNHIVYQVLYQNLTYDVLISVLNNIVVLLWDRVQSFLRYSLLWCWV